MYHLECTCPIEVGPFEYLDGKKPSASVGSQMRTDAHSYCRFGSMKRAYLVVGGALCVMVLVVVGFAIFNRPVPSFDFEWAVEEGAVFEYEVRAWGDTSAGSISESLEVEILSLDGTTLRVIIVSLPLVSGVFNATTFGLSIVSVPKASCTLTNGTDLEGQLEDIVNSSISGCFLPIGGWSGIDSLYSDELPYWGAYGQPYYASKLSGDHLQFGYTWFGPFDDSGGWSGNVTLSDGVPSRVLWHYSHQYWLYIEFSLVE